jgi:hypothetical protein
MKDAQSPGLKTQGKTRSRDSGVRKSKQGVSAEYECIEFIEL